MRLIERVFADRQGSMVIETAVIAPVLALMALGSFEVGSIVSRQHELQSAATEGEVIALAAARGATTNMATVKSILQKSVDLGDDDIKITRFYRCNDSTTTVTSEDSCDEDDVVSSYIKLALTDTYTPVWTEFGVGKPVNLNVERTVQLS